MSWNRCGHRRGHEDERPGTDLARLVADRDRAPGRRRRSTARPRCAATADPSRRPRARRARPTGPGPAGTRGSAAPPSARARSTSASSQACIAMPPVRVQGSADGRGRDGPPRPGAGSRVASADDPPSLRRLSRWLAPLVAVVLVAACGSPAVDGPGIGVGQRGGRHADGRSSPFAAASSTPAGDRRRRAARSDRRDARHRRRSSAAWPARSTSPRRVTAADASSWSSRRAGSGSSRPGRLVTRPFLDIRGADRERRRARPPRPRVPSRLPGGSAPVRRLHRRRRQHGRLRVPPGRRGRRRRRSGLGTDPAPDRPAVREPQRRRGRLRTGRHALHRRPATAAPAAIRRATASGSTRCWRRSCGSTSTARRIGDGPTRIPADNPFVDDAERAARDLADRPAQPVADALRCGDRRPLDRRRRTGRLGGDRRRAGRRRRPRLRLERDGGHPLLRAERGLRPDGADAARRRIRSRPGLRRHRWRGRPRSRPAAPRWRLPVLGFVFRHLLAAGRVGGAAARASRWSSCEAGRSISSIALDEDGTVLATDLGGGQLVAVSAASR